MKRTSRVKPASTLRRRGRAFREGACRSIRAASVVSPGYGQLHGRPVTLLASPSSTRTGPARAALGPPVRCLAEIERSTASWRRRRASSRPSGLRGCSHRPHEQPPLGPASCRRRLRARRAPPTPRSQRQRGRPRLPACASRARRAIRSRCRLSSVAASTPAANTSDVAASPSSRGKWHRQVSSGQARVAVALTHTLPALSGTHGTRARASPPAPGQAPRDFKSLETSRLVRSKIAR